MSDMFKRFIFERVSENIITKPWMAACYRDYQTREIVMAAWPLNYAIQLAWMLNLAWQRYRHRESWIDRMIASEARLKSKRLKKQIEGLNNFANERFEEIQQVRRERDEAREAFKIVYNERVQMELERDEWKNKAYSYATDYTLMEAKCFRLEQQLKEYDKLKS